MRREIVYLEDIVRAADDIEGFLAGRMPSFETLSCSP
jgi:hypothetical protein